MKEDYMNKACIQSKLYRCTTLYQETIRRRWDSNNIKNVLKEKKINLYILDRRLEDRIRAEYCSFSKRYIYIYNSLFASSTVCDKLYCNKHFQEIMAVFQIRLFDERNTIILIIIMLYFCLQGKI